MKNLTAVFVLAILCVSFAFGQNSDSKNAKPNFSGTWLMLSPPDEKTAQPNSTAKPETKIIVVQKDAEVHIKRAAVLSDGTEKIKEFVYFADGRGETNISDIKIFDERSSGAKEIELRSKTKWSGNVLYTRGTSTRNVSGHFLTTEIIEKWELSKDGTELTHTLEVRQGGNAFQILRPSASSSTGIIAPAKPLIVSQVFRRAA